MGKIAGKEGSTQRLPAEQLYQEEIDALIVMEQDPVPTDRGMSPRSALIYITGETVSGKGVTPEHIGSYRLVKIIVATLITDRALFLVGEPGTAKPWLSEHLTVIISGDLAKVTQGTTGTTEEHMRYSRNYAMLIAQGPPREAMIKSLVYRVMETGSIARFGEVSRCVSEVQDALTSILSEKRISIPELVLELPAQRRFPVTATANTGDKGVNEMSAALKRRLNIVIPPPPSDTSTEMEIVKSRMEQLASSSELRVGIPHDEVVEKVCTVFREPRGGMTLNDRQKVKPSSGVLSIAEIISLLVGSMALAGSFGNREMTDYDLVSALQDAVVRDEDKDGLAWREYLENVMKRCGSRWLGLYKRCKGLDRQTGHPNCFGVHHPSPAGVYHLKSFLDEKQPDLILVGGPSDFNGLMDDMVREGTKPSFAVMAFAKDSPIRTISYPFTEYSPEYQVIVWAKERGTQYRFMDLPSDVFLEIRRVGEDQASPEHTSGSTPEHVHRLLDWSNEGNGHETLQGRVMEHSENHEAYRDGVDAFGRQLRELAAGGDSDRPGILVWEVYMRRKLGNALREKFQAERIVVVTSAYHVAGLAEGEPAMIDAQLGLLPSVPCDVTLTSYSYYRLSTCSGYGASNQAPVYYGMLWQALLKSDGDMGTYRYLTAIPGYQRQYGFLVLSAGVVETVELARSPVCLKGYSVPFLRDLRDTAMMAMGHGSLSKLASAITDTEIGTAVGELLQRVSRTCLQDSFYRQLRKLKLGKYKTETAFTLSLDLREKLNVKLEAAAYRELRQSFFLHRLRVLGIYFAVLRKEQQEAATWAESWDIRWTPEVEVELVESALRGDTVASATSFAMREQAVKAERVGEAADIIEATCCCDIPEMATYTTGILQGFSVEAADFMELAGATQNISVVMRFGNIRHLDGTPLLPVLNQMFLRTYLVFLNSCTRDSQTEEDVTETMDQLNGLCLHHNFLNEERSTHLFAETTSRDDLNTSTSGFVAVILLERDRMEEEESSHQVHRRLSRGIPAEPGVRWFVGLFKKNRYALIVRLDLRWGLNAYMDTLDDREFKWASVFLCRVFAVLNSREKLDVVENLSEIWQMSVARAGKILNRPLKGGEMELPDSLDGFNFDDIQGRWNIWSLKPE